MTFRFFYSQKKNGNNEVPLFLRVNLRYYSLLSILGISEAIQLSNPVRGELLFHTEIREFLSTLLLVRDAPR
jgi:hypothetical protein